MKSETDQGVSPEQHELLPGSWCPNNPSCPLLIFRNTLPGSDEELAKHFEETFERNGWPPAWRYTIFDYPHYHSTTHEVIGIFRGEADVRFGDDAGFTARLTAGDILLIPAGVSHQRLWQTDEFQGVGAYPEGCDVDEVRKDSGVSLSVAEKRIRDIATPPDPLKGGEGLLRKAWRNPEKS
jgi:uncharacterized protein YjlB